MRRIMVRLISFYQRFISPLKPSCCRFYPTCSEYSKQAFQRFGIIKGTWLTVVRILKCHPFYKKDFYDPVPEMEKNKKQSKNR